MNDAAITLSGCRLHPLASGALFWPERSVLIVSDLHLGKAERMARRGGAMLPPYETRDTLTRLAIDIDRASPRSVICLGDSFDDRAAAEALTDDTRIAISRLQAGRRWVWIEGNHDPGPVEIGGEHRAELPEGPLTFRHVARAGEAGEVSGHYHPKAEIRARGRTISRPCFLHDDARLILPAYGTYTGGLRWTAPELRRLFGTRAFAALTGDPVICVPAPWCVRAA